MGWATILSIVVWVIGVPVIVFLIVQIARRLRQIDVRIAKLREEEAQNAQNPYAAMAQLYEAQQLLEEARGGGKKTPPSGGVIRAGRGDAAEDDER